MSSAPHDLVLVLEASTASASVALLRGTQLLGRASVGMGASREDGLFPAVQALLTAAGLGVADLGAIVCGAGPGSFTSLRIAAALAKGLSHASGVTLYAVPSLLLAAAAAAAADESGPLLVHSDALRDERYVLAVTIDAQGMVHADGDLARVPAAELATVAGSRRLIAVAGGAATFASPVVTPDAAQLVRIFEWRKRGAVDMASWEPAYGRLAEAQVKWESQHQRPLSIG